MAQFFTSDWHIGEKQTPNTHSFLRPYPTEVMAERWLAQCFELLKPEDELIILGDLAVSLDDLDFYRRLPPCTVSVVVGDKETGEKFFKWTDFLEKVKEPGLFDHVYCPSAFVMIEGKGFRLAHKPTDLFGYATPMPSICGHVHGIWRTACMPNGEPLINVGIDAWGGLVSEAQIIHQYRAIKDGLYDKEARIDLWT